MRTVDPVVTGSGPPHGYLRILGRISPLHLFPDLVRDPIGPRKEDLQSENGGLCV